MPMMRPKPRQDSQAPTGELNENSEGTGSRYDRSQSAQCSSFEYFQRSMDCSAESLSSTTCRFTRPRPTRSAVSSDSMTRERSAPPRRSRSCTTSSVSPIALVDARVALRFEQLPDFGFLEVLRHRHRETHVHARIAGRGGARVGIGVDALRAVAPHGLAAVAAVKASRAREQQLQVIVELGHRADGGARGAHRIRLVDGDGGRNAVDAIDRRLVHAIEELPRVRREGFDVTPLAFGIQRVEHQRRLARARHARDHHELVQRNLETQVLEIVLARTVNHDRRARLFLRGGEASGLA